MEESRAKEKWESILESVGNNIVLSEDCYNGTGYFVLRNFPEVLEVSKFKDCHGRRGIVIPIAEAGQLLICIFERYNPESTFVLVANTDFDKQLRVEGSYSGRNQYQIERFLSGLLVSSISSNERIMNALEYMVRF